MSDLQSTETEMPLFSPAVVDSIGVKIFIAPADSNWREKFTVKLPPHDIETRVSDIIKDARGQQTQTAYLEKFYKENPNADLRYFWNKHLIPSNQE